MIWLLFFSFRIIIIFIIYVCIDMEFLENDNNNEQNYIDENDAGYKWWQMVQTGVALHVNHFIKCSLKEPCRTSPHLGHSFVLEVLNIHKDRCHQQFRMEKHVFNDVKFWVNYMVLKEAKMYL